MNSFSLRDGRRIVFDRTEIMGIMNATPDSFYAGSRTASLEEGMARAEQMLADGALFLDIGGESTRPGSDPVTAAEEMERVIPLIGAIKRRHPGALVSVDTYHASTARAAVNVGADIINDISALSFDPDMAVVVAETGVPVILMHAQGTPKHMQDNPQYTNVVEEIFDFFRCRIDVAIAAGIRMDRLILDPGIGFGKNVDHNIQAIRGIDRFKSFGLPLLLAVSRKTFIGTRLGGLPPEERLEGTIAVSCFAALHDVEIVRVHDVRENLRAVRMMEALK